MTVLAAWTQAILSVAAVIVATKLQDRGFDQRAELGRVRRLEAVAATIRYIWQDFRTETEDLPEGMHAGDLHARWHGTEAVAWLRALSQLEATTLGDYELVRAVLDFEADLYFCVDEFQQLKEVAQGKLTGRGNVLQIASARTRLFNAAASVERLVAEQVGRSPLQIEP